MKRNSTTLFLTSPGATTPIPWVNNAPDFSAFTEPTLSVLQQSWQDFVDSGVELEVIPDPAPFVEPPAPNWKDFNFTLFTDTNFVSYGLAAQSTNPYLVPAIVERYGQIAKIGLIESGFADYWNAFCASLGVTVEHRDDWSELAEGFNLPADFISVVRGA
jgi:hypothetical protein